MVNMMVDAIDYQSEKIILFFYRDVTHLLETNKVIIYT